MQPLETLYASPGGTSIRLPARLAELYGGNLELAREAVYANFVTSLDGVAALPDGRPMDLSGRTDGDRFVMGLLRAAADAILIGAGTLRGDRGHRWTPDYIFPEVRSGYAELRRELEIPPVSRLVVLTASGQLPADDRAFAGPALILTTLSGADRLPAPLRPLAVPLTDEGRVPVGAVMTALRERGYRRILVEGGPQLFGQLVAERLVDELFLTLSPALAGRGAGDGREGLIAGHSFPASELLWSELSGVRRQGDQLFVRYRMR